MTKVLLKVDDLKLDGMTDAWRRFLAFCKEKRIHSNIGLIARWPLECEPHEQYMRARQTLSELRRASGSYSLWNHGLFHSRDSAAGTSEFRGAPLSQQMRSIRMAQDRIERLTGRRMAAFGAPFNWWDQNTIVALQHYPEIKYVFHLPYVPGKLCYHKELFVTCEPFEGEVKPGAKRMFSLEEAKEKSERFLELGRSFVLQLHPNSWKDGEALERFAEYTSYLADAGYQWARVEEFDLRPQPPEEANPRLSLFTRSFGRLFRSA